MSPARCFQSEAPPIRGHRALRFLTRRALQSLGQNRRCRVPSRDGDEPRLLGIARLQVEGAVEDELQHGGARHPGLAFGRVDHQLAVLVVEHEEQQLVGERQRRCGAHARHGSSSPSAIPAMRARRTDTAVPAQRHTWQDRQGDETRC
jgi:hypothetical protein